jgi:hypothetical protein
MSIGHLAGSVLFVSPTIYRAMEVSIPAIRFRGKALPGVCGIPKRDIRLWMPLSEKTWAMGDSTSRAWRSVPDRAWS